MAYKRAHIRCGYDAPTLLQEWDQRHGVTVLGLIGAILADDSRMFRPRATLSLSAAKKSGPSWQSFPPLVPVA
jgi:hypothetical protein